MEKLSWKIGFGQVLTAKAEKIPWLTALYHASADVTTTLLQPERQICSLYRWKKTPFGWEKRQKKLNLVGQKVGNPGKNLGKIGFGQGFLPSCSGFIIVYV